MEIKSKIKSTIFLVISFIILIGTIFYRVKAATAVTTLIDDIRDWDTSISYSVGTVIDESGIEDSKKSKFWLCYSHKTVSGLGTSQRIKTTLEINTRKLGTYISRAIRDGKYENSGVKSYANSSDEFKKVVRELNYLIFAATQDSSKRYVGDAGSSPSKNALYYYVNTASKTQMKKLIGDIVNKRTSSYTKEAESKGSNILKLASKYAEAEEEALKNKSSADITDSEDAGATVKVATADNGTTYSYIGPFYIKTAGTVTDVILKEGSKEHAIAGYSSKVGQNPTSTNAKKIPKNGNTFYILTEETAIEADSVKVTIKTEGTTGGVEFEYYKSDEDGNRKKVKAKGYIKSRIAFLGNNRGQGTAVFSGKLVETTDDKDSVKLLASNTETPPGKLVLKKVGLFVGEGVNADEYENLVEDFGFQIYRLDGSTKKYLRIEDQDTMKVDSIVIDETTSYDASESQATTLYTPASGKIVIEGLNTEYEYYIVEADNSKTDYKSEAYRWSYKHYQNGNQNVGGGVTYGNENGNVFGPITITYNGVPDEITRLSIRNYRKTGDLLVKKVDVNNTNKKLGNVEFILLNLDEGKYVKAEKVGDGQYKVTDPATGYVKQESDATTFVTNSSTGELSITGLDVGEYQIIETKNPNYGYIAEGVSEVVVVKDSATEEVVMGNESYLSDLKIQKQDADDSSIKMSGVEFRLKRETSSDILGTGYVIAQQKDSSGNLKNLKTVTGSISCDGVAVTNNPDEATIFITDANGEIVVRNMISGVYTLEELSAGDSYGYLVNEDSVTWEIINYGMDAGIVDEGIIGGDDSGNTDQDTDIDSSLIEPEGIVGGKSVIIDLSGTAITVDGTEQIKTVIVRNQKQTGNLKIQKQDADSAEAMAGVSFKIKRETSNDTLGSGYIIAMQKDSSGNLKAVSTVTGNIHLDGMEVTNNADQATTFITDENGKIGVYNLLVGTYTVEEISVGDRYGYYVNGDYVTWEVSNGASTTTAQGISATIEVPRQPASETSENAVGTGTGTDVTVKNEKQTGNLKIEKQDADNAEDKMDNISFKIKRETSDENLGSGYVIAMQKNGSGNLSALDTVTGSVHLDGMDVTNDPDNATTFVTDSNGKAEVYNILKGRYTVEEVSVGDKYGYYVNDNYVTWEISSNGGVSATAQGTTATMDIPRQPSTQTSESAVGTGTGTDVIVKNEKQTGNLKIQKKDADNDSMKLQGISFRLRRVTSNNELGSGYVVAMQGDSASTATAVKTATGRIYFDNMTVTQNADNATIFVTDQNGLIEIYNILIGEYVVEEISVGDNFGYDIDAEFISWEITNSGGSTSTVNQSTSATVQVVRQPSPNTAPEVEKQGTNSADQVLTKNTRKYIKIRGFAWEDRTDGKNSTKDYIWKENTEDKRLANIPVRLISNGRVLDEAITDENGEYVFGNYDEDSSAIKIEIDDLVGAYIEFTYNGMSYQSIVVNTAFDVLQETDQNGNTLTKYSGDTNKSSDEAERPQFNDDFSTISKGRASNGNYEIKYDYDSVNYISTVRYGEQNNLKYGYEGQKYPIYGVYEQYEIIATTQTNRTNALCTDLTPQAIRENAVVEIGGLNLGVEERAMPDLFVLEDIQDVQISLNGYTHTYEYAQRFNDNNSQDNPLSKNPETGEFNVGVKFASKYIEGSYSRTVYSSDVVYNQNNPDSLQVLITYIVKITNESSVYTRLNTLANYYDERYENVIVRDAQKNNLSTSPDSYNQNGLRRVNIQTSDYLIAPGETKDLFITYELNNDAINSILNGTVTLESVSEVASYSSFSDAGSTPYAGIDIDSAADSTQPQVKVNEQNRTVDITGTLEDDVDKAPSLILEIKEGRMIAGTVWEDSADPNLLNLNGYDKERKGDGVYDEANENVVENAKVELLTVTESGYELANLYKKDGTVVPASTMSNEQGNYEFSGVIPANYVIRYTYGDNDGQISAIYDKDGNKIEEIQADDYKSTIYRGGNNASMDAYWYRAETSNTGTSRLSDARDTIAVKKDGTTIDDIVGYRTTQDEEMNYQTTLAGLLKTVSADTASFEIKLDYDVNLDNRSGYGVELRFLFDNIDLGIIERPRQYLDVDKKVANLQIVLANGNDLVNGNPETDNLQGVKVLNDDVYIEIDNEIIQGATLRINYAISVDNSRSEIDYNSEDYYIYGKIPENKENAYKVVKVVDMYDYLPEDLVLQEGGNWQKIDIQAEESQIKGIILADKVYDTVKDHQNVVHLANQIYENMAPGEVVTDTSLIVSKQLSTSTDDLTYENDVEIVKLKGGKTYDSIPGNYDPTTNKSYDPGTDTFTENEPDDDEVEVTITPPTGEAKSYWMYVVIGISTLIVIGAGVVIIKKKVL